MRSTRPKTLNGYQRHRAVRSAADHALTVHAMRLMLEAVSSSSAFILSPLSISGFLEEFEAYREAQRECACACRLR